jgi:hypothetical protein
VNKLTLVYLSFLIYSACAPKLTEGQQPTAPCQTTVDRTEEIASLIAGNAYLQAQVIELAEANVALNDQIDYLEALTSEKKNCGHKSCKADNE